MSKNQTGKHIKKGDLPQKICANCGLSFSWRKKWQCDWDKVKYCSERCKRTKPKTVS